MGGAAVLDWEDPSHHHDDSDPAAGVGYIDMMMLNGMLHLNSLVASVHNHPQKSRTHP
jgi:hypothetical protein